MFFFSSNLFSQKALDPKSVKADTLLQAVIKDSLFLEYSRIQRENFDEIMKSMKEGNRIVIGLDDKRIDNSEARSEILRLRNKGVENPEYTYIYGIRGARLIEKIYLKFPALKEYPKDAIARLSIYLER